MNNFVQYTPTKVVFGKGTEMQAGDLIKADGGSRVFVVYGGGSAVLIQPRLLPMEHLIPMQRSGISGIRRSRSQNLCRSPVC